MLAAGGSEIPSNSSMNGVAKNPAAVKPAMNSNGGAPTFVDPKTGKDLKSVTPPGANQMVSFTKQVAPMLVSKCGGCHVTGSRGGFNMANYTALMKGSNAGVVVFPGDIVGSELIDSIESGDMPRGGGSVSADQLTMLKRWVQEGAKFDGPSPDAPLASFTSAIAGNAAPAAPRPTVKPMAATGNETVSFAKDVAPLLLKNCNGCHIDAMRASGGLRMDTFAQLLRGGDSGGLITPGNGDGSLLVQRMRGEGGDRMPGGGRPPLPDDEIKLISTWITEGAKIDGNPDFPLRRMSALAWAKSATHQEMIQRRKELADDAWQLGAVGASRNNVASTESENFFVLGSVNQSTLDQVAEVAETTLERVRTVIRSPGEPYFRGRATIFVFPKRYEYSEFAKMVEGRGIPSDWRSHWRYDGVDANIPIVIGQRDDPSTIQDSLLAPLASLALASRGDVPDWFADGVGRAAAAKLGGRDFSLAKQWNDSAPAAMAKMKKPDDLTTGKLAAQDTQLVAYAFGTALIDRRRSKQFDALVKNLHKEMPFDAAFQSAFRSPVEMVVGAWMGYRPKQNKR
ncbi:MAG: c-type cytochrome domain-containing protein, partial [Planctomycetota bacterium]